MKLPCGALQTTESLAFTQKGGFPFTQTSVPSRKDTPQRTPEVSQEATHGAKNMPFFGAKCLHDDAHANSVVSE